MNTIVTTYDINIFEMFYKHKYNEVLHKNLILYIDKNDSRAFRNIVNKDTMVFDKNDFEKFYGASYLTSLSTYSKVYFLNFLLQEGILNDSFYFTDDDVFFFNNSLTDIENSELAIYDTDMMLKIHETYRKWRTLYKWITDNWNDNNSLDTCATNFYFPTSMMKDFKDVYLEQFKQMHNILLQDRVVIDGINRQSRSKRNKGFAVFYLDTPFFNVVFAKLGLENFKKMPITLTFHSDIEDISIEKYVSKLKGYPTHQPLQHFSVVEKYELMKKFFEYYNGYSNMKHETRTRLF